MNGFSFALGIGLLEKIEVNLRHWLNFLLCGYFVAFVFDLHALFARVRRRLDLSGLVRVAGSLLNCLLSYL